MEQQSFLKTKSSDQVLYKEVGSGEVYLLDSFKSKSLKQGFLSKEGAVRKSWKSRYFIVDQNLLYYTKTPKDKKTLGAINLKGCVVDDTDAESVTKKKFSFCVCAQESYTGDHQFANRVYYFVAKNDIDKLEWMNEIAKYGQKEKIQFDAKKRPTTPSFISEDQNEKKAKPPTLYHDWHSSTSRALLFLLAECQHLITDLTTKFADPLLKKREIPVDYSRLNLDKQQVPVYVEDENDILLTDTIGIMKHLVQKYELPDNWFPMRSENNAPVLDMLKWYQEKFHPILSNIIEISVYSRIKSLGKVGPCDHVAFNIANKELTQELTYLDQALARTRYFAAGQNISIVDALICSDLASLSLINFKFDSSFSNISRYLSDIEKLPTWMQAHTEWKSFVTSTKTLLAESDQVVVFGACGHFGKELLKIMKNQKVKARVKALIRTLSMDAVTFLQSVGLEEEDVASGCDFTNPSSYESALLGIDKLVLITPNHPDMVNLSKQLIDASIKNGCKHIVKLSLFDCHDPSGSKLLQWHHDVESYIQSKEVTYTFVRSNWTFQSLQYQGHLVDGKIKHTSEMGTTKKSWVDARDVLSVVTESVVNSKHHQNKSYNITGSEELSVQDMASILTEEKGKSYDFETITSEDVKKIYDTLKIDTNWSDALLDAYKLGKFKSISHDFEKIVERKPLTFRSFAKELS